MGFDFQFANESGPEAPASGPGVWYRFTSWEMGWVNGILLNTGAAKDPNAFTTPGWEPTKDSVDLYKFKSNDGWLITPEECRHIASRLRKFVAENEVGSYLSFFDDDPPKEEVEGWLTSFADYCENAAENEGFKVW